ncbi:MAG TPA: DoxX family membrane protein [Candidatus Eremiobacteraceae bacterium]
MSIGLLLARLLLGLGLAAHGAQKLFGWFGGYGIKGTGGFFEGTLGLKPGALFATMSGLGEFGGGLLVATGWLGPVGPALIISVMVIAMITVHWKNGFFVTANGVELPLMNIAGALALAFAGFGAYALDAVAPVDVLATPQAAWIAIIVAVVGALLSIVGRKPPAPAAT